MTASGWFRFQMEAMPEQVLDLSHAGITLFGIADPAADKLSVNVDVWAAPRMVTWVDPHYPEDGEIEHRIAPAFYTEWFDIPRSGLAGRGADAVDNVGFDYDMAAPDAPPDAPGAINQDSHGLFKRAQLAVSHTGDGLYHVRAEGVTEFGWTFALEAEAPLERVVFRHQDQDLRQAPHADVEAAFEALFDRAAFTCDWARRGSPEHGWFDFIASRPVAESGVAA